MNLQELADLLSKRIETLNTKQPYSVNEIREGNFILQVKRLAEHFSQLYSPELELGINVTDESPAKTVKETAPTLYQGTELIQKTSGCILKITSHKCVWDNSIQAYIILYQVNEIGWCKRESILENFYIVD